MSVAQGGLFGMVDMVEMRRKGLLKRLKMTPVKMGLFGVGGMMVRFVLGVVQIVILALIGVLGFGANLHLDFSTLVVAFFIGALAFNALGYLFSSFSKSIEAYMGLANIASFLMMFLSGIFFPTNGFPEWLQPVSQILPLTYFVNGIRDGMVYGSGIATSEFWAGIGILGVWGVVAFGIGVLIYRKGKVEVR
ncbi:ABC transporter permease [Cohnella luojiensis]|uniref:ABC transporter permease n=1 Tax=Cohnella luojiensis TaxID=652876 RepID=UPI001F0FB607|nr:ABC transporter permease [Cohnella luojiensis]